jgi:hypothetical protein
MKGIIRKTTDSETRKVMGEFMEDVLVGLDLKFLEQVPRL